MGRWTSRRKKFSQLIFVNRIIKGYEKKLYFLEFCRQEIERHTREVKELRERAEGLSLFDYNTMHPHRIISLDLYKKEIENGKEEITGN